MRNATIAKSAPIALVVGLVVFLVMSDFVAEWRFESERREIERTLETIRGDSEEAARLKLRAAGLRRCTVFRPSHTDDLSQDVAPHADAERQLVAWTPPIGRLVCDINHRVLVDLDASGHVLTSTVTREATCL